MQRSDIIGILKKQQSMAKEAFDDIRLIGNQNVTKAENNIALNWCQESVEQMMQVMSLGQQKKFVRKIKDSLVIKKNISAGMGGDGGHSQYRQNKIDMNLLSNHALVDETLEKIREKIIDRNIESE